MILLLLSILLLSLLLDWLLSLALLARLLVVVQFSSLPFSVASLIDLTNGEEEAEAENDVAELLLLHSTTSSANRYGWAMWASSM